MFQPFGDVRYSESDFESQDKPLLAVAGQWENNDLAGATNADDLDTRILGAGRRLQVQGALPLRRVLRPPSHAGDGAAFDSNGFHAQIGYFLVRDRLEVAGRWAGYDPTDLIPDNDRTEVGGVVNYYLNRHNLKLQGDFRQLDDDSRGISAKEIRVQTQVVF